MPLKLLTYCTVKRNLIASLYVVFLKVFHVILSSLIVISFASVVLRIKYNRQTLLRKQKQRCGWLGPFERNFGWFQCISKELECILKARLLTLSLLHPPPPSHILCSVACNMCEYSAGPRAGLGGCFDTRFVSFKSWNPFYISKFYWLNYFFFPLRHSFF